MTNIIKMPMPRPTCQTEGCGKPAARMNWKKDGSPAWRKWCGTCHDRRTASKHGLKSIAEITAKRAGFDNVQDHLDHKAREKGFKSYVHYSNSKHPYLRHRKDYCENIDGRLGFVCTSTIPWDGMLDVDHIDGDPSNNDAENCQTLCKCCHAYKTWKEKDWLTPGRKALGIKY